MNVPLPSVDDATFDRTVASGTTLVQAGAPWCTACRTLAATLAQMALGPGVRAVHLDVAESPGTAARLGIAALPTLLLFREGALVARRTGSAGRSAIQAFLEEA